MKKKFLIFVILLLYSVLFAYTKDELIKLPAKQTDFYEGPFSRELFEKVRALQGNPAEYIAVFDDCYTYKNHELTAEEKKLFQEYFSYLPPKLQACFLDKVYAIYFIDGMVYGGLTDFIFDENQNKYCVMYLNSNTFHIDLDSWLTYRDNTIFTKTDELNRVKVQCSDKYKGFLHVLTHEAVHVYDYINEITPYMDFFDGQEKSESEFYKYWKDKTHPIKKYNHQLLSKFSYYYFGNQIPLKKAKNLINYLSTTPFSTLYGAKNFQDDFAETLTFYIFKKKLNLNYKIEYISNGKTKASYSLEENPNIHVWDSLCQNIVGF